MGQKFSKYKKSIFALITILKKSMNEWKDLPWTMDSFMKPTNWLWNPAKLHKKKAPKKVRKKATRGKDQNLGK
jgi:hypothetical protein